MYKHIIFYKTCNKYISLVDLYRMKLQNYIPIPFSYFQIVNGDLVDITYRVMQCDQSFSRRLSSNKVIEDTTGCAT